MKRDVMTVRVDNDLKRTLDEVSRRSGRTRSEILREPPKRHLAQLRLQQFRPRARIGLQHRAAAHALERPAQPDGADRARTRVNPVEYRGPRADVRLQQ